MFKVIGLGCNTTREMQDEFDTHQEAMDFCNEVQELHHKIREEEVEMCGENANSGFLFRVIKVN
jgi:hypothetical protein